MAFSGKGVQTNKNSNMSFFDIASPVAGAVGGLVNRIGQKKREERQMGYTKDLMGIQQKNQMALNEQGRDLSMDIWNKTNYGPQVEKMKEAGLNPALMYGSAGAGGTTSSGSGGGAGGGSAPNVENMPMGIEQLMSLAKLKEEKDLLKAQKEKTDAEREKLSGVDTEKAKAETASLTQGIENQKTQEGLLRAQTTATNLSNMLAGKSMDAQVDILDWTAKKVRAEADSAFSNAYVDRETRDNKVTILEQEMLGSFLENAFKEANISKTKEETDAIAVRLEQDFTRLEQGQEGLDINRFKEEVKANYPSIQQTIGRMSDNAIDQFLGIFGRRRSEKRSR